MTVQGADEFVDSSRFAAIPDRSRAMLPVDGEFAVDPAAAVRLSSWRWYTVTGDYARAGAIDYELGNPCYTPARLQRFVIGRRAMGKRARVYVDRADAAGAVYALRRADLLSYGGLFWWIPTLDGIAWTPEQLAADLAERWHANIPAGRIWANQNDTVNYGAGPVDRSRLFLEF